MNNANLQRRAARQANEITRLHGVVAERDTQIHDLEDALAELAAARDKELGDE